MKKILLVLTLFLSCYFIYSFTNDKKISYLTIGDSLSKGTSEYGTSSKGYSEQLKEYLFVPYSNYNFEDILDKEFAIE